MCPTCHAPGFGTNYSKLHALGWRTDFTEERRNSQRQDTEDALSTHLSSSIAVVDSSQNAENILLYPVITPQLCLRVFSQHHLSLPGSKQMRPGSTGELISLGRAPPNWGLGMSGWMPNSPFFGGTLMKGFLHCSSECPRAMEPHLSIAVMYASTHILLVFFCFQSHFLIMCFLILPNKLPEPHLGLCFWTNQN